MNTDIYLVNNSGRDVYAEISRNDTNAVYTAVNALGPWRPKQHDPQPIWEKPVPKDTRHIDVFLFHCRDGCMSFWKESFEPGGRHILVVDHNDRIQHMRDHYDPPPKFPSWVYFTFSCAALLAVGGIVITAIYRAQRRRQPQGAPYRGLSGGGPGTTTIHRSPYYRGS